MYVETCLDTMPLGENINLAETEPGNFVMITPTDLIGSEPFTFPDTTASPSIELTMFIPTVITSLEIHTTSVVQVTDISMAEDNRFQLTYVSIKYVSYLECVTVRSLVSSFCYVVVFID